MTPKQIIEAWMGVKELTGLVLPYSKARALAISEIRTINFPFQGLRDENRMPLCMKQDSHLRKRLKYFVFIITGFPLLCQIIN